MCKIDDDSSLRLVFVCKKSDMNIQSEDISLIAGLIDTTSQPINMTMKKTKSVDIYTKKGHDKLKLPATTHAADGTKLH